MKGKKEEVEGVEEDVRIKEQSKRTKIMEGAVE